MALILPAYAKLNLTLDVTGRRPDGYHEIDSVMQTISLHDLIWIERTDCRVFDVVGTPIDGENLVLKAARELEGHVSRTLPFTIRLYKRIPMGAGLGGGSADAAAFLKAANLSLRWNRAGDRTGVIDLGVTAAPIGLALPGCVSSGGGVHPRRLRGSGRYRTDGAPDAGVGSGAHGDPPPRPSPTRGEGERSATRGEGDVRQ